jgi:hypothetical protein
VRAVGAGVVGGGGVALRLDLVEDGALESGGVSLDGQEVVRAALAGDVGGRLAAGVGGVGGDDRPGEVDGVEQGLGLGGLVGFVGDPGLGDDHAVVVLERREQLDRPVADAAQPLAVDRDVPGRAVLRPGRLAGGQGPQPAADDDVEGVAVQVLQQGPDPLLARHRDSAAQRARDAAERGEHLLGQVGGLVADLPKAPGPGQHAHDRDRQRERQPEPPAPPPARVGDLRQRLEQAGSPILADGGVRSARRGGGMGNWHRWPLVPKGILRGNSILPNQRPSRRHSGRCVTLVRVGYARWGTGRARPVGRGRDAQADQEAGRVVPGHEPPLRHSRSSDSYLR